MSEENPKQHTQMNTDSTPIVQELVKKGFAYMDIPVGWALNEPTLLAREWAKFLCLPDDTKSQFCIDGQHPDPDNGFIVRRGNPRPEGGRHDPDKRFFHFRPHHQPVFSSITSTLGEHGQRTCIPFIGMCAHFYTESHLLYTGLLHGLSKHTRTELKDSPQTTLRLLEYGLETTERGESAQTHIDRSFLTIHIGDSHPGLVYDDGGERQTPHVSKQGKVLIFLGKKAELLGLKPLPHGVLRYPEYGSERRWAIVFFGHIPT